MVTLRPTATVRDQRSKSHQKLAEIHKCLRAGTLGIATPSQVLGSLRRSAVQLPEANPCHALVDALAELPET